MLVKCKFQYHGAFPLLTRGNRTWIPLGRNKRTDDGFELDIALRPALLQYVCGYIMCVMGSQ